MKYVEHLPSLYFNLVVDLHMDSISFATLAKKKTGEIR